MSFRFEGSVGACDAQCVLDVVAYIQAGFAVPIKQECGTDTGVLCDGFEGALIDSGKWSKLGAVSLSTEQKYSGSQSVKVVAKGGGYNANGIRAALGNMGSLRKNQYGRMMMLVTAENPRGGDFTFVEAVGKANYTIPAEVSPTPPLGVLVSYRARVDGSVDKFANNYDTNNNWKTDCWSHSGSPPAVPKDTWACMEWNFNATSNELTYWLNGTKMSVSVKNKNGSNCVSHSQNDLWTGPAKFDSLQLGANQYKATDKPRTLYIDDVVVDTQRVGCPSAP